MISSTKEGGRLIHKTALIEHHFKNHFHLGNFFSRFKTTLSSTHLNHIRQHLRIYQG